MVLLPLDDLTKDNDLNSATSLVNTKIERTIDLSSQLVKVTEKILVENPKGSASPLKTYLIALDQKHSEHLAYIDVTLSSLPLKVQKAGATIAANGFITTVFKVDLGSKQLPAGETLKQPLVVTMVFTHLLQNYPKEIAQNERQFVKYHGHQHVLSPYITKTQTTKVKLPEGSRLESFSKATKQTTGSGRLTYGPFKDVPSALFGGDNQEMDPLECHFENNNPFVAVRRLQRSIEVSHWGSVISIENEIDLEHVGAKLKGSFSRYDYQRDHSSGLNSVRAFLTRLPTDARDIYYRDAIGNISTSDVRKTGANTLVNVRPRFPLFGGWVTNYKLGYTIQADKYLATSISSSVRHKLTVSFADLLFENMVIDESVIKVVLPEGSSNIKIDLPFEYERKPDEVKYSYLDTIGRPVIVLRKTNLVDQHIVGKSFNIYYNYSKLYLIQEPILLMMAIFLLCLTVIVYSRLNFSISTKISSSKAKSGKLVSSVKK